MSATATATKKRSALDAAAAAWDRADELLDELSRSIDELRVILAGPNMKAIAKRMASLDVQHLNYDKCRAFDSAVQDIIDVHREIEGAAYMVGVVRSVIDACADVVAVR